MARRNSHILFCKGPRAVIGFSLNEIQHINHQHILSPKKPKHFLLNSKHPYKVCSQQCMPVKLNIFYHYRFIHSSQDWSYLIAWDSFFFLMVLLLKWHLLTGERKSISRAANSTLFTGTKLVPLENNSSVMLATVEEVT